MITSTFLPEAALNLDQVFDNEEKAELIHQFLAKLLIEGLITEDDFNERAAEFREFNSK